MASTSDRGEALDRIFTLTFALPPQQPLQRGSELQFFATIYLDGLSANEFRNLVSQGEYGLTCRLFSGTSDSEAIYATSPAMAPSFGPQDLSLIMNIPAHVIENDTPYLLSVSCSEKKAGDQRTPFAACLALCRNADGWL